MAEASTIISVNNLQKSYGEASAKTLGLALVLFIAALIFSGCKSRSVSTTEAEQNPVACAQLVADSLGGRSEDLVVKVALGYASSGDCERAFQLADSLKERERFRPNAYLISEKAIALDHISSICSRNGNLVVAEKAHNSALQMLERDFSPRVRDALWEAYKSLAVRQAEFGNIQQANRLVTEYCTSKREEDDARHCHVDSWLRIANELDAAANKNTVDAFVKMAVPAALQIKQAEYRVSTLTKAATLYFALGESEEGKSLLSRVLTETLRPGEVAYRDDEKRDVANVFLEAGDFQRASNTIALLSLEYKRSWAWRNFAVMAAKTGDFQLALQTSKKISGFDDKADVLKAIVKLYVDRGDLQKAVEICEQIEGYGNRADARLVVARKYVQTNDLVNAKKFLDLAVEDVLNESSGSYKTQWDRHLKTALLMVAIGEKDRAITVIKEISKQELSSADLVEIASEVTKEGNYDLAIEIASFVTTNLPCDHCQVVSKEEYQARILVDVLLKHAEAKMKGMDQGKNVTQTVLKILGLKP